MYNIVLKLENTLKNACKLLKEKKSGAAIIMKNNSLKGIFTEKDLVNIFADSNDIFADMPIEKFMTKNVITVEPKDSIIKALAVMKSNSIRHLPVYSKSESILYGVISYKHFTLKILYCYFKKRYNVSQKRYNVFYVFRCIGQVYWTITKHV